MYNAAHRNFPYMGISTNHYDNNIEYRYSLAVSPQFAMFLLLSLSSFSYRVKFIFIYPTTIYRII